MGMTNEEPKLTADELESAKGEALPDREAMTILPVGVDPLGGPFPLPPEDGGGEHTLPVEPPVES
jgi:hypothetical protein